jgi:hypothetical protein
MEAHVDDDEILPAFFVQNEEKIKITEESERSVTEKQCISIDDGYSAKLIAGLVFLNAF